MISTLVRVLAASAGMLIVAVGCASKPPVSDAPAAMAETGVITASSATLVVHGMSCPLCASNVDKQLLEVPGVDGALVDMGTGEVKVSFVPEARVTRKQLEDAVYKSGFTLAEVRVP